MLLKSTANLVIQHEKHRVKESKEKITVKADGKRGNTFLWVRIATTFTFAYK